MECMDTFPISPYVLLTNGHFSPDDWDITLGGENAFRPTFGHVHSKVETFLISHSPLKDGDFPNFAVHPPWSMDTSQ